MWSVGLKSNKSNTKNGLWTNLTPKTMFFLDPRRPWIYFSPTYTQNLIQNVKRVSSIPKIKENNLNHVNVMWYVALSHMCFLKYVAWYSCSKSRPKWKKKKTQTIHVLIDNLLSLSCFCALFFSIEMEHLWVVIKNWSRYRINNVN